MMSSQGDQVLSGPNIIKDEQVWFDDGNLVVFVGPECRYGSPLKGDVYAFKPSRGFLGQHGHVFAAAFHGQSGDPNETFEGVQYVIMPDHWEDMRDFMRMIHGFSFHVFVHVGLFDAKTTQALAGPLRLSKKYGLDKSFEDLVAVLERDWPSSYDEWFKPRDHALYQWSQSRHQELQEDYPNAVLAIRLGHELGIKSILHAAYYDHNSILYTPLHPLEDHHEERYTRDINIGIENVPRLFHGRERMRRAVSAFIEEEFTQDSVLTNSVLSSTLRGCTMSHDSDLRRKCQDAVVKWQDQTYDLLHNLWSSVLQDPAGHFKGLADGLIAEELPQYHQEICAACRRSLAGILRTYSRQLWDKVPSYFDLKSV